MRNTETNAQIGQNCLFHKGLRGPVYRRGQIHQCPGMHSCKIAQGAAPDPPEGVLLDSVKCVFLSPVEGRW